ESDWRDDFAYSRNISLRHATGAWILWLDADDVVPASSLPLLQALKRQPADRVYGCIVRNERPGNTGTEFVQARMFPNRPELRFERRIHEQIMPSALRIGMRLEPCDVVVEHHGYADPDALKSKAARNVRLLLQEYPLVAPDAVMAAEIADAYQLVGNDDKAAEWYRALLDIPGSVASTPVLAGHAHYGLGTICNKMERHAEAIDHFHHAMRLSPWRPDVIYGLAVAQELAGDPGAAVESLRKIPLMKPQAGQVGVDFRTSTVKAFLRLIRLLVELERYKEAGSAVREAIDVVGQRPEVHLMAGKFYLKTGALLEALHAFEKSLHLRRDGNIEAYIGLCLIYRSARRDEKVTETLEAIRSLFMYDGRYCAARRILLGSRNSGMPGISDQEFQEQLSGLQRDFFGML
ncbi:MAG: tetratricopeptide repeat protein, partial [Chitinispirillaceae bacterium]|nr:tetratricopeptide repeat protein [Chitinispirillaceae bacterium]